MHPTQRSRGLSPRLFGFAPLGMAVSTIPWKRHSHEIILYHGCAVSVPYPSFSGSRFATGQIPQERGLSSSKTK